MHPMDDWGNHRLLLWLAMNTLPVGPVMEFGCGMGSTRQLSELCKEQGRHLYSFDTEEQYLAMFKECESNMHSFHRIINNWHIAQDICPNPSVMLIDHAPGERRIVDMKNYSDKDFGIMVVHDTQPPPTSADYGYERVWPLFKYRVNLEVVKHESGHNRTWASAVSNVIDVRTWAGIETGFPDYKIVSA